MEIVDGQIHAWRGARTDSLVAPHIDGVFDEKRLVPLLDFVGVARAIIVTPVWTDSDNEVQLEMARRYPDRFGVMGYLAVDAPESPDRLHNWLAQPGMLGVRFSFSRRRHAVWLTDGTASWIWDAASLARVPVTVYAPLNVRALESVLEAHSELRLTLDHMAVPLTVHGADLGPYIDALVSLARFENVSVKVSSLPHFSAAPYPHMDVWPHLLRVIDVYGPHRCFWGSDITWGAQGLALEPLYSEAVTMMNEALASLDETDKGLVMGGAIHDWLRWKASD